MRTSGRYRSIMRRAGSRKCHFHVMKSKFAWKRNEIISTACDKEAEFSNTDRYIVPIKVIMLKISTTDSIWKEITRRLFSFNRSFLGTDDPH